MTAFRGLATVRYHAEDLAAARSWYTEVLGLQPYVERADHIEFRLGDHLQQFGVCSRPQGPAHGGTAQESPAHSALPFPGPARCGGPAARI
ncbi:hypothetical protein [Kitasatospora sp. DSM 101779]|uniref:hypothetical protein n=1 Tax=Kitasatospora sp. DSM 101779 TaxID=2853165 RepID=UPI0021D872C9|nr:hypothetical protein [Kitasatospora sp. DSM 101779]MCU7826638.1 hypothetical protein [Kitasatospora sp. DSM 101779]